VADAAVPGVTGNIVQYRALGGRIGLEKGLAVGVSRVDFGRAHEYEQKQEYQRGDEADTW